MINPNVAALILRIGELEEELEAELAKQRTQFSYTLHHRKIRFEQAVLLRHRELKKTLFGYIVGTHPLVLLTAPFIYSLIVPFVLLDLLISLYQAVCFPIYGIQKVARREYLVFDRHHLAYLNGIEKLNCLYCSYGNGLLAYAREIAARTEQYWCPIKHAQRVRAAHDRYHQFSEYGDAENYRQELETLRQELKKKPS